MSSVCISNCVKDTRVPVRATYVNLYKWPESDAEFVRRRVSSRRGGSSPHGHARVVDSISCRQMYLRSYKFSRKEETPSVPEKITQKCFGSGKKENRSQSQSSRRRRRKCLVWKKMKHISCAALFRIFHKFLSCTATVDVVHAQE